MSLRDCPNGSSTTTATTTTTSAIKHESGKHKDSGKHEKPEIECPEEPNCDGSDEQDGAVCDSMGRMHKLSHTCTHVNFICLLTQKHLRICARALPGCQAGDAVALHGRLALRKANATPTRHHTRVNLNSLNPTHTHCYASGSGNQSREQ